MTDVQFSYRLKEAFPSLLSFPLHFHIVLHFDMPHAKNIKLHYTEKSIIQCILIQIKYT